MFARSQHKIAKRNARRRGLHRRIGFRLQYGFLRGAIALLLALPPARARALGRFIGRCAFHLDRRHRRIGMDNLDRVYESSLVPERKREILRLSLENAALGLIELLHEAQAVRSGNPSAAVETTLFENHPEIFDHPRGVLLVSGHIGNWFLAPSSLSTFGFQIHAVAREIENPLVHRYYLQLLQVRGARLIPKVGAVTEMLGSLAGPRRLLALLLDQNAGSRGTFVDFLGTIASTNSAPLLVAKRRRVPIVVAALLRTGPMQFRLVASDVVTEEEVAGSDFRALTARANEAIGRLILAHPEQWLWTHRRWKSRPPEPAAS